MLISYGISFVSYYILQSSTPPELVARWRAHAEEVLALQCVLYKEQVLVLSGAGDHTVRLWSIKGHYIGTFGQVGYLLAHSLPVSESY